MKTEKPDEVPPPKIDEEKTKTEEKTKPVIPDLDPPAPPAPPAPTEKTEKTE